MKLHNGLDTQHLVKMLGKALVKERDQWKPVQYKSNTGPSETGGIHRDEAVNWLLYTNSKFHFTPETVALSITMLDRFLVLVKVRPKYIQCVALCCYYIAAKTMEEEDVIPSTVDLVKTSQCGCSVSDILRMEMIILDKLKWNPKTITQIDFLHIIHSLLMCYYPQLLEGMANMTPSRQLSVLSRNLFHCLANHKMVKFRPITLTLAIISLELEQITMGWLSIINTVQKLADIEVDSLIHCREIMAEILKEKKLLPTGYKFNKGVSVTQPAAPILNTSVSRSRSFKRKAEQVDLEDDVYDGIKRLYADDPPSVMKSCGSEIGLDSETSTVTSLQQAQPVSAN